MTVRAQSSTALMWGGVLLCLLGLFTSLFGLVEIAVHGHVLGGLVWFLLGGVSGLLGLALLVIGWRSRAVIDGAGIQWTSGLGGTTRVVWEQVAQVHVPGRGDAGRTVELRMRDGSVVPVTPLRRTQSADDSTALSPRYLRAGGAVQQAHQAWWAAQRR